MKIVIRIAAGLANRTDQGMGIDLMRNIIDKGKTTLPIHIGRDDAIKHEKGITDADCTIRADQAPDKQAGHPCLCHLILADRFLKYRNWTVMDHIALFKETTFV